MVHVAINFSNFDCYCGTGSYDITTTHIDSCGRHQRRRGNGESDEIIAHRMLSGGSANWGEGDGGQK